jgi:4-amino-4-deoxy-L-arabinose transferase-like glycosyltransferase
LAAGGEARWLWLAVLATVLFAWLAGLAALPPLDRDESRFAEASRQMVQSGDYIDIRFASGPRYNKPIGIYWLQSAAANLTGQARSTQVWPYRLPSFLGGCLTLLLVYGCARRFLSARASLIAAGLLGTTLLLTAESMIATTDAALLACVVAAQSVLLDVYVATRGDKAFVPSRGRLAFGWIAVGVGILLKGPVILTVLAVTAIFLSLWDRSWRWLVTVRPVMGAGIVVILVAPWAIAIGIATHGAFYQQSLGHDFGAKILGGQESHGAPPGYYLALASLTFWPGTLFLLPALAAAFLRRNEPFVRFLLVWIVSTWLMFELTPTKLPHYILPAYPALALLLGVWMEGLRGSPPAKRWLRNLAFVQFGAVAIGIAAACVILPMKFGGALPWSGFAGVLLALCAAGAAAYQWRQPSRGAVWAMLCASAFYIVLTTAVAPQLPRLWLGPRAAALVEASAVPHGAPILLAGFVEPSLVFLLQGNVQIVSGAAAANIAADHGGLALVDAPAGRIFVEDLTAHGGRFQSLGAVTGFNYSTGHAMQLTLYRAVPRPHVSVPQDKR